MAKAPSTVAKKNERPVAVAKKAGKTNKTTGSVVKCEVKLEKGTWISPDSCATFYIDDAPKFPKIVYEISTEYPGPYKWSWSIEWIVRACPQKKGKERFKAKHAKTFLAKGQFTSDSKSWTADLNAQCIGGTLTVKVLAGKTEFVRKTIILGKEPGEKKILTELEMYSEKYPDEVRLAKKIFKQETGYLHFYSDERPLVSFDNGYGLGQATEPIPSFEQAWNWKKHIEYIVTIVIKGKRSLAKKYLEAHSPYSDEELDLETLVFYNGANSHYLVWNDTQKKMDSQRRHYVRSEAIEYWLENVPGEQ